MGLRPRFKSSLRSLVVCEDATGLRGHLIKPKATQLTSGIDDDTSSCAHSKPNACVPAAGTVAEMWTRRSACCPTSGDTEIGVP